MSHLSVVAEITPYCWFCHTHLEIKHVSQILSLTAASHQPTVFTFAEIRIEAPCGREYCEYHGQQLASLRCAPLHSQKKKRIPQKGFDQTVVGLQIVWLVSSSA